MAGDKPMGSSGFRQELKRRHVYRAAAACVVVGGSLIQVATQAFPVFHSPGWIDRDVVLMIVVGFPIARALAWAFDATAAGIVRTGVAPASDATNPAIADGVDVTRFPHLEADSPPARPLASRRSRASGGRAVMIRWRRLKQRKPVQWALRSDAERGYD